MIFQFDNKEYEFQGKKFLFKVNKNFLMEFKLDDIEKFILKNEGRDISDINIDLQKKFDINNFNSYKILWDKLHKLYIRDIIIWKSENPFEDMYEYNGKNFNFRIEVSVNKNYNEYYSGTISALAKNSSNYVKNINNMDDEPFKNVIFLCMYNKEKVLGRLTLLLSNSRNSYVIGSISLDDEVNNEVLNNFFIWAGSRLCLIFGQICKTIEFRIDKNNLNSKETKKLIELGFEIKEIILFGKNLYLLKKNI